MKDTTTITYEGVGKTKEQAYADLRNNNELPKDATVQYRVRINSDNSVPSELFPEYEAALIQGIDRSDIPASKLTPDLLEVRAVVEHEVKNEPKPTGSMRITSNSTLNDLV